MTPLISVDVEASGPTVGLGDLVSFGAVFVTPELSQRFYSGIIAPLCDVWEQEAYSVVGITRQEHLAGKPAKEALDEFVAWLQQCCPDVDRFIMLSDNPGFDFAWVQHHLLHGGHRQWLGHSARRIGDAWAGLRGNPRETQGWKKLRRTAHTHNPLDDALGNAEAWLAMWEKYGGKR